LKKFLLLIFPLIGFSSAWGEISIQNDQQFFGDDGSLHIVGELKNNFNAPINQIKIDATLYSDGILVDTIQISPMLNTVMPEMKNPFAIIITGDMAREIDEYSLSVSYKITEPKSQVIDITTSDFSRDNFDNLMITGTVANRGEITANTIVVVATLYDKNGNVAAVSKTLVQPDYLRANDESFFFIPVPDKIQSGSIVDYSIAAESEEYTAVPEFPLGSMVLLATSVSAYIVLTRYSSKVIGNLVSAVNLK
jgi:hypothetical protein